MVGAPVDHNMAMTTNCSAYGGADGNCCSDAVQMIRRRSGRRSVNVAGSPSQWGRCFMTMIPSLLVGIFVLLTVAVTAAHATTSSSISSTATTTSTTSAPDAVPAPSTAAVITDEMGQSATTTSSISTSSSSSSSTVNHIVGGSPSPQTVTIGVPEPMVSPVSGPATVISAATGASFPSAIASDTNYASALLGARIVEHHEDCKGANNVLIDDREKYLRMPCRAERKYFTVQLPRRIEVEYVTLQNNEFFSSTVKDFVLLGRSFPCSGSGSGSSSSTGSTPPPCTWRVLGHFQANATRSLQRFDIAVPPSGTATTAGTDAAAIAMVVKYVRFLWVSHHGNQPSCTLTSFAVFGRDEREAPPDEVIFIDFDSHTDEAAAQPTSAPPPAAAAAVHDDDHHLPASEGDENYYYWKSLKYNMSTQGTRLSSSNGAGTCRATDESRWSSSSSPLSSPSDAAVCASATTSTVSSAGAASSSSSSTTNTTAGGTAPPQQPHSAPSAPPPPVSTSAALHLVMKQLKEAQSDIQKLRRDMQGMQAGWEATQRELVAAFEANLATQLKAAEAQWAARWQREHTEALLQMETRLVSTMEERLLQTSTVLGLGNLLCMLTALVALTVSCLYQSQQRQWRQKRDAEIAVAQHGSGVLHLQPDRAVLQPPSSRVLVSDEDDSETEDNNNRTGVRNGKETRNATVSLAQNRR